MMNLRNTWKVKLEPRVQREEWREVRLGKKLGRILYAQGFDSIFKSMRKYYRVLYKNEEF